jgi:hypothetical protein
MDQQLPPTVGLDRAEARRHLVGRDVHSVEPEFAVVHSGVAVA